MTKSPVTKSPIQDARFRGVLVALLVFLGGIPWVARPTAAAMPCGEAEEADCLSLSSIGPILFVQRNAYRPSHIYSDYRDSPYEPGGGVFVLRPDGRTERLFDGSDGICRDPELSFDARKILFSFRRGEKGSYHLYEMNIDGSGLRQLTDGPYDDIYPAYLPDGRVVFVSTRCRSRVFCFFTDAATLFVMDADGANITPLSSNNVNEFSPSVMPDGRILFTRWEYQDKNPDHSQSLWSVNPDGTGLAHVYGNTIPRPYSYLGARCVPGTHTLLATLGPHFGGLVGPIGLIDRRRGDTNPAALRSLTPEFPFDYSRSENVQRMHRAGKGCCDPYPLDDQTFLASYGPDSHFALCAFHLDGRRKLLYRDPELSSFGPIRVRSRVRPPVLSSRVDPTDQKATLLLANVYQGLKPAVAPGTIKYLRVVEEVRSEVPHADGNYVPAYEPWQAMWYAAVSLKRDGVIPTPTVKTVHGLVPVEADGSAYFHVPAKTPIYFQALDKDLNEIQRMRSLTYLRAGETQACIGCHEPRHTSPPASGTFPLAARQPPRPLQPPEYGVRPFSYVELVQPVLDRHCVDCHGGLSPDGGLDLSSAAASLTRKKARAGVAASCANLLLGGYCSSPMNVDGGPELAAPMSFGTLHSKLIALLDAGHYDVQLTRQERQRLTTWIDLNCPLWSDYEMSLPHVE